MKETNIEYKLSGYEPKTITLETKFNWVSIINLGNIIGWGVDLLTGSVMKYDRKKYDIKLWPLQK